MTAKEYRERFSDKGQLDAEKKRKPKRKKTAEERAGARQIEEEAFRLFARTCTAAGLPPPVKEHTFHHVRRWRFDYFFRRGDVRVALEIEGGIWGSRKSRHTTGSGFRGDMDKYNAAAALGIHVVRATPEQRMSHGVPAVIAVFDFYSSDK